MTLRRVSLITAAVHNNAAWCDAVCRAFGCDTTRLDGLWLNRSPAPPYYSNAVTLDATSLDAQRTRVRAMLDSQLPRPWTVKDGFHVLDLAPLGFDVLFEAEWLGLGPDDALPDGPEADVRWVVAGNDADLVRWESAWRGLNEDALAVPRLFQPVLLDDPDLRFLSAWQADSIVAVVAANRSDGGHGPVVGISNIVLGGDDPEGHRAGAVSAVRAEFPGLPMVGYEWGKDLEAMLALGFRALGPLRVWITSS